MSTHPDVSYQYFPNSYQLTQVAQDPERKI